MDDAVVKAIVAGALDPATCVPSAAGGAVWRIELPAGRALATWIAIAKAAPQTKVWPILRGKAGDIAEPVDRDPADILAAAPVGTAREVLGPRMNARRAELAAWEPAVMDATEFDQLAAAADASGANTGIPRRALPEAWPTEQPRPARVSLNTLREVRGQPSTMLLIKVERSSDVPAHLGFGGWNDCPEPGVQVAVLHEWRQQYGAVPAAITGDVLECVVVKPPRTEARSMSLAAEQWIFCDDLVGQGTATVRRLAAELRRTATWFFWWD